MPFNKKKIITLIAAIAVTLTFVSCSEDDHQLRFLQTPQPVLLIILI